VFNSLPSLPLNKPAALKCITELPLAMLVLCTLFLAPLAQADETGDSASLQATATNDLPYGPRVKPQEVGSPIKIAEVGLDGSLRFLPTKEPLSDTLINVGDAGLGVALRFEDSLYVGGGVRYDLVPLYQYEGEHFYLQAYRVGAKFLPQPKQRIDMFLTHRFEGYPYDITPDSLVGMAMRSSGLDAGISYQLQGEWGNYFAEYLRDVSGTSLGSELQIGYSFDVRTDGLKLTPSIAFSVRDAKLNDYYYGVRPDEATASRPAYEAGAGFNTRIGVDARYDLTKHWLLLGGIFSTRWSDEVRDSPIVQSRIQLGGFIGLDYVFSPEKKPMEPSSPLIVKALYGQSTDCNLLPTMVSTCVSTQTADSTSITGLELGKPFFENFNGWPIDFIGYVSVLRHNEQGLQPDFLQFNAYMKAYYYGFPWSDRVRTRIGFGVGLSYAQSIPYVEARDQIQRGKDTYSKLLNYLDPSIDISVGDLLGIRSQRETYFGFGVSHRSGIFGTSQVLGNVYGGSNYIYTYLEWRM
jgi:MipA family protein